MPKELVKNTGVYISMSILTQGLIFLLWIVLALWLAPSQIGIYTLMMVIIEFFSAINIFGLDSAITRFYYTKEEVSSILSNALTIFLCSSFLTLIIFLLIARFIPILIPELSNILENNLLLFMFIILANSATNFVLVHYTALKRALTYAKLQFFKILCFLSLSLLLVYLGNGILGVFYSLLFSSLLVSIFFVFKERRNISFHVVSPEIIKKLIFYGSPLMLYSVLGVIIMYFNQLLLNRYTNLASLGVYSFFLMLTVKINGLWSSFNRAWTPEIFSKLSENRENAMENIKFMAFFSSLIYLVALALLIVFGELFLFKLILKEAYLSSIYLFYILLLGPLFTGIYTVAYPLYYYENKTQIILYLSIFMSGVNLLLTFFLIKNFGQTGAAVSFFTILALYTILYLFAFKNIMEIPFEIINWTLVLATITGVGAAVLSVTRSSFLFLIFLFLGMGLSYRLGNLHNFLKGRISIFLRNKHGS